MRREPQASKRGSKQKGTRRLSVPKQFSVEEAIGGWDEELLPV